MNFARFENAMHTLCDKYVASLFRLKNECVAFLTICEMILFFRKWDVIFRKNESVYAFENNMKIFKIEFFMCFRNFDDENDTVNYYTFFCAFYKIH